MCVCVFVYVCVCVCAYCPRRVALTIVVSLNTSYQKFSYLDTEKFPFFKLVDLPMLKSLVCHTICI